MGISRIPRRGKPTRGPIGKTLKKYGPGKFLDKKIKKKLLTECL
jgi:hypothetical protein